MQNAPRIETRAGPSRPYVSEPCIAILAITDPGEQRVNGGFGNRAQDFHYRFWRKSVPPGIGNRAVRIALGSRAYFAGRRGSGWRGRHGRRSISLDYFYIRFEFEGEELAGRRATIRYPVRSIEMKSILRPDLA